MTFFNNELYLKLTFDEKINYLNKFAVPKEVKKYITEILKDLVITVPDFKVKDNILKLMYGGMLEGWCFETTESAIVFFNNYDYISRGYIYINETNPDYHHSWITFKYDNKEYIFDASLNFICTKEIFLKLFNPRVDAIISAKMVKEKLIEQYLNQRLIKSDGFKNFLKENLNDFDSDLYNNEFYIFPDQNINSPFFRNSSSYEVEMDNNKIKKMATVYHFSNLK